MLIQGGPAYELFPVLLLLIVPVVLLIAHLSKRSSHLLLTIYFFWGGTRTCSGVTRHLACLLCGIYIYTHIYINTPPPYINMYKTHIFLFVSPYIFPACLEDFIMYACFPVPSFVQVYNSPLTALLLHIISIFLLRFVCLLFSLLVVLQYQSVLTHCHQIHYFSMLMSRLMITCLICLYFISATGPCFGYMLSHSVELFCRLF